LSTKKTQKSATVLTIHPEPKEKEQPNAGWAFNLDPVHGWAYWENAFTEEECDFIIKVGNSRSATKARVQEEKNAASRKSEIAWLYPADNLEWVYRRMTDIITDLNNRFFKFDLFGAMEGFQFTKYAAPSGKYGKHVDCSPNNLVRKLSFTLQLSKPESYTGGDLCLYFQDKPEIMKKNQGYVVLFPSYVLHEVKPVTEGTRYSLVSWITGSPFK